MKKKKERKNWMDDIQVKIDDDPRSRLIDIKKLIRKESYETKT